MKYKIYDGYGILGNPTFETAEAARAWVESNPVELRDSRGACVLQIEAEYRRKNLPDDNAFDEDKRAWPFKEVK